MRYLWKLPPLVESMSPRHMEARSESSSFSSGYSQPPKSLRKQPKPGATHSISSGFSPPSAVSKTTSTASKLTTSRILPSKEHGSKAAMNSNSEPSSHRHRIARVGSAKPKLCPRREFGPAQDLPTRQYSLRYTAKSKSNGASPTLFRQKNSSAKKDDLFSVLTTKVSFLYFWYNVSRTASGGS